MARRRNSTTTHGLPTVASRHSLQRKLVLWTLMMVVAPTGICALWLNRLAHEELTAAHSRNAGLMAQALATALAGRITDGFSPDAERTLDALFLEKRLAFVVVTDPNEHVLHRRSIDSQAWATYTREVGPLGLAGSVDMERPLVLGEARDIVVRRVPVWNPPTRNDGPRAHEGFVLLGLRDRTMPAALSRLRWAQTAAAAVVCVLCLPIIWVMVRRWFAPLRALLIETMRLGRGRQPQPVPVQSRDEIGRLSEAFNDMASGLAAAHHQLSAANEQLERQVEARTAELQQVNEQLENEIREKNNFLRAVSHDLGAPLRNIAGMTSLLITKHREQLADDALSKLDRIGANAKAQIDMLNDLLELSRIRTRPGRREPVDLHTLIEELRDHLSYDLEASRIELIVANHLPTIVAERNRMRQVFQNLLENAAKYMLTSERRRIEVGCEAVGDGFRFHVADTGCGIAQEDQPHVFDVFRRANHSGSHQVPGKGVGLASVKAIVECYGGRIWLDSTPGCGTTIHFTLHAEVAHEKDARRPVIPSGPSRQ